MQFLRETARSLAKPLISPSWSRRIALKGNIEHLRRVALWSRLNLITDGEMTTAYLLLSAGPSAA
jgi:hypothetical protein